MQDSKYLVRSGILLTRKEIARILTPWKETIYNPYGSKAEAVEAVYLILKGYLPQGKEGLQITCGSNLAREKNHHTVWEIDPSVLTITLMDSEKNHSEVEAIYRFSPFKNNLPKDDLILDAIETRLFELKGRDSVAGCWQARKFYSFAAFQLEELLDTIIEIQSK